MACFHCKRPSTRKRHRLFSREELNSATSGFSASTLLGRGSHGSVFLAKLDNGRLLAAAKLPAPPPLQDPSTSPSSYTANEIAVLSSLPASPLLVNLLGRAATADPIAIVEFMPNGSLDDLIHRPIHHPPFPFPLRLRLALRAATAVASLHALHPPVLHRDIKPSNILLDANGRARLADFGLAVRGLPSTAAPAGTIGYLDPVYLSPGDLSVKTDVYSFGVVQLELLSGRRAIDVEYSPASVVKWAVGLIEAERFRELWDPRGGVPQSVEEEAAARDVARLAARSVGSAPERRPTMEEVVACLRSAGRKAGFWGEEKCWWKPARRGKVADAAAERRL
ncbi:serine/threonine-protein kinase-like protein At1g28390 [Dendrobium catenatum]|uniref:Serine/threonine-protein kinase-like protein n=1 Tax=Dendrobium catenatum TaxID=906689 RepID=A0A2I0V8M9_9ASPA|nr:serine/threonine-protein kinase-like protein At1g28390 [Dendrobium catenatum]PKU59758.1 Serine/threonine-protein kinase-like protein [Dendrobium catenatum]